MTDVVESAGTAPVWKTKNEAVYQALRQRILVGDLAPGSTIDPEALAAQLGVSRTPLREAIRRLQVEQLIETAQHLKVQVSQLTARELRELYVVRLSLEPLASQLCAENATDAELAELSVIVAKKPADGEELQAMNRQLHTAIYRASGNEVLIRMLDQLWDHADRYRRILAAKPTESQTSRHEHAEHEEVVAAIVARKPELASDAMRRHLVESIDVVNDLIEQMDGLSDT